jgi:tripartite-type tricarboxylate transporter receptor subunit TctC
MKKSTFVQTLLASVMAMSTAAVMAQAFPNKQLNMVVAFSAGGASDSIARIMSKEMAVNLNQPIIVDNVTGVGGSLGVMKLVNAPADGYTMITGSPLELILAPLGIAAARNKPQDVRMVALGGLTTTMLVVRKDLPVNTFEEFIALAKKKDGKPLAYGSVGVGSLYHLEGEKLSQMLGAEFIHAPYPGIAQIIPALMGGTLDFAFMPIAGPFPGLVDNGSLKGLVATSTEPSARLPKIPLTKNTKGFEDFIFNIWAGIQVNAKTPDNVVAALHKSAYAALANPEVKKALEAQGTAVSGPKTLAELDAFYAKEVALYQAIARSIKLVAQ